MNKIISAIFIIFIYFVNTTIAQNNNLDIFLLIGQSNMAGRAPLQKSDKEDMQGVLLLNDKCKFELASNPLNKYSSIRKTINMQQLGLGYSFALEVHKHIKSINLGLVVNARGGSSIIQWQPDSLYFNEIVKRAKQAQVFGKIGGILWHQGESDSKNYKQYPKRFKKMIKNLKKQLGDKKIPVFIGEIGKWRSSAANINNTLYKIAKRNRRIYLISAKDLTHKGDNIHFSHDSQIILGKRYAAKILEIVYNKSLISESL